MGERAGRETQEGRLRNTECNMENEGRDIAGGAGKRKSGCKREQVLSHRKNGRVMWSGKRTKP